MGLLPSVQATLMDGNGTLPSFFLFARAYGNGTARYLDTAGWRLEAHNRVAFGSLAKYVWRVQYVAIGYPWTIQQVTHLRRVRLIITPH